MKTLDKFQRDIYTSLTDKGFNKLISCLKDKNEDLRKLAFKVLVDLLYNNEILQNLFCEKFNFNPVGNVICLNWLPKTIKENIKLDSKVLKIIKESTNVASGCKYWMWPENSLYNDENLPDPLKYLLGVYYGNQNVNEILLKK